MRFLESRRAPNPIDITTYVIFDPNTGAARAWYWRGENVSYEFFDGPGFHPRNGEPLKLFTKEAMQIWEHDIRAEKERLDKEAEDEKGTSSSESYRYRNVCYF